MGPHPACPLEARATHNLNPLSSELSFRALGLASTASLRRCRIGWRVAARCETRRAAKCQPIRQLSKLPSQPKSSVDTSVITVWVPTDPLDWRAELVWLPSWLAFHRPFRFSAGGKVPTNSKSARQSKGSVGTWVVTVWVCMCVISRGSVSPLPVTVGGGMWPPPRSRLPPLTPNSVGKSN